MNNKEFSPNLHSKIMCLGAREEGKGLGHFYGATPCLVFNIVQWAKGTDKFMFLEIYLKELINLWSNCDVNKAFCWPSHSHFVETTLTKIRICSIGLFLFNFIHMQVKYYGKLITWHTTHVPNTFISRLYW